LSKIAIVSGVDIDITEIERLAPGWEIFSGQADKIRKALMQAEIVAGFGSIIGEIVRNNGNLRWVQSFSAGVDSYPLNEMKEKGIMLTNAAGIYSIPIAESVIGMMLGFSRGLFTSLSARKNKQWIRREYSELHGLTVGILGAGLIGGETARLAKAFGMKTLGFRKSGRASPFFDEIYTTDRLNDLLSQSDFIVNILPMTPETNKLIDGSRFGVMKKTACYISVGRGRTTDQNALIDALKNHMIAFAGLDVTDPEPLPPDSPLWDMENVLITPHISGLTPNYLPRVMSLFLENLKSFMETGRPARNIVDYNLMY
jgi:phosphoglycerate dehydrogenase-like enzyme